MKKYTVRDIADFVFLYCITLQILRSEFDYLDFTSKYARDTIRRGSFKNFHFGANDLYALVHMLESQTGFKDHKSNELFLKNISFKSSDLTQWLRYMRMNRRNEAFERRFLLSLQSALCVNNAGYRASRRLAAAWDGGANRLQKQLVVTRLLLAFRTRCRRSDLLPKLEELAKKQKLEIKGTLNPETGEPPKKKSSFLAKAASLAAGAAVGHYLTKAALGR